MYIQSRFVPNLTIDAETNYQYRMTEYALSKLLSKPVGNSLLTEINLLVRSDRSAIITTRENISSCARPMLTPSQFKQFPIPEADMDIEYWRVVKGSELINAKTNGGPGIGTTAVVEWNPHEFVYNDLFGNLRITNNRYASFISLSHELIHMRNILKGDAIMNPGEGEERVISEEFRVIGMGDFEHESITENKIRNEHHYPFRTLYHHVS